MPATHILSFLSGLKFTDRYLYGVLLNLLIDQAGSERFVYTLLYL